MHSHLLSIATSAKIALFAAFCVLVSVFSATPASALVVSGNGMSITISPTITVSPGATADNNLRLTSYETSDGTYLTGTDSEHKFSLGSGSSKCTLSGGDQSFACTYTYGYDWRELSVDTGAGSDTITTYLNDLPYFNNTGSEATARWVTPNISIHGGTGNDIIINNNGSNGSMTHSFVDIFGEEGTDYIQASTIKDYEDIECGDGIDTVTNTVRSVVGSADCESIIL